MKKELFEVWFENEGKELAKSTFPIDDVDDKNVRKKAKQIFSSVGDYYKDYYNESLYFLQDIIDEMKFSQSQLYENYKEEFTELEDYRKNLKEEMFDLYDSYITKKDISKEYFEKSKERYVEKLAESTQTSKDLSLMISILKACMKSLDRLQIN